MKDNFADEALAAAGESVAQRARSLPHPWRRVLLLLLDSVGLGFALLVALVILAGFGRSVLQGPVVALSLLLLYGGWVLLYYLNRHYDTRVTHRLSADTASFVKATVLAAGLGALALALPPGSSHLGIWLVPLIGGVVFVPGGLFLRRLGWAVLSDRRRKLPLFVTRHSLLPRVREVVISQPWGPFSEPESLADREMGKTASIPDVISEPGSSLGARKHEYGVVTNDLREAGRMLKQPGMQVGVRALVWTFPDFIEQAARLVPVECLDDEWAQAHLAPPSTATVAVKRVFDLVFGIAFLLVALPLGLLIAMLIELDAPGAVFYFQRRPGLRNREFTVFKFRTMDQPHAVSDRLWASVDDPRVTRFGRILRLYRLNELPQLLNVLWGSMSLVGPRPELPNFVRMLAENIPGYSYRHLVKPGMTGWAQINFSYGASVEEAKKKLEYDLYYVKHCSVWFDLYILLRTFVIVLGGKGR